MISLFLLGLAALIALAIGFVLPALLRGAPAAEAAATADARQVNLQVLRDQLAALEAEHAAGGLDAEQYQRTRTDIERRALEEEAQAEAPAQGAGRSGRTAVVVGLFVPFFALLLYGLLGAPQALLPGAGVAASASPPPEVSQAQVEEMVQKLAQRMESKTTSDAGDLQGWVMLARSYGVLQRYPEASRAYERARALAPDDVQLLVDHADVLAMVQGQKVNGAPMQLVERALALDPRNVKGLALAGSAAFERQDYQAALRYWNTAHEQATPGSDFAQGLESGMREAREAMAGGARAAPGAPAAAAAPPGPIAAATPGATGGSARPGAAGLATANGATGGPAAMATPALPTTSAPGAAATAAPGTAAAPAAARLRGTVRLAPALAAQVRPTDTVFVFARAEQGPRMPLAILKRTVADLPLAFNLDDSSAMSPEMRLSNFPRVVVGARISRSGDAMPRSGDLLGQSAVVAHTADALAITIDAVQP